MVLGEGISQISESSYQTALASTSSTGPDDVANLVEGYDNIEDDMQQYVNANCSGKWRFNSKYLRKMQIVLIQCFVRLQMYIEFTSEMGLETISCLSGLH